MRIIGRLAAVVAFVLPVAALADINATATLNAGQGLSLDTGTITTSGDILFTGTSITYVGSAKGGVLPGETGSTVYGQITLAVLQSLAALASTTPIPTSSLTAGTATGSIIAVQTNAVNGAKLLVTALSSSSITFQYTTFGATAGGTTSGGPTVSGIVNNYSYIPSGFPNSGVSPGSIITIFGSNMSTAPSGTVTLQSSASPGIPTTLAGATISVTVGGKTVTPAMYYATPTQIAAVLPSSTPTGTATLTVTYNGTPSNAFSFQVVPSALGFDTYYGTGSGLITATTGSTLFSPTNSAAPGQTIVLWGSGLGADTADSDTVFTNTPHAVNQSSLQIYFGTVAGTVQYAGSSGYPGVNQINVTIPASAPTGCAVSVVGVIGSDVSNFGTLPINNGNGVCTDSVFGLNGTQIASLGTQTTVKSATLFAGQTVSTTAAGTTTTNFGDANFQSSTGSSYGSSSGGLISLGGCTVTESITAIGGTGTSTGLDAGTVSLVGPAGTYLLSSTSLGAYIAALPASAITSSGGVFTFNWTGGAVVGAGSGTINLPNPLLTWTNQSADASVTRASGIPVTWTGGGPGSIVYINGSSSGGGVFGSFTCYAPQSALSFTVPAYVAGLLPAGNGSLMVENIGDYTIFSPPGLDFGLGFGFTGFMQPTTFK